MHSILAVAAAHQRHKDQPARSPRSAVEIHHSSQCVQLFNRQLSRPVGASDRDPLWATAALLGIMMVASFDGAAGPEGAWPLRPSHPLDLEWFQLSEAKMTIWHLVDPVRPGGVFRPMAHEYARFDYAVPAAGAADLPPELASLCGIDASTTREDNAYFVAAHGLVQLRRVLESGSPSIRLVSFVSQSQPPVRRLLREKDPVALLLLASWYALAGPVLWWLERRARVEYRAIRIYLDRFHGGHHRLHAFLSRIPQEIA
jgi:hypothetical protein